VKILFRTSFTKDVKKTPQTLQNQLSEVMDKVIGAEKLESIPNLKKMKGANNAYRIRLNNYRICFYYEDKVIIFARFLPRKDVYKVFP
jgi:mRNA interferase RelE/StbE